MKLWLVQQFKDKDGRCLGMSAVVAALSEDDARHVRIPDIELPGEKVLHEAWTAAAYGTVTYVGEARPDMPAGAIVLTGVLQ